MRMGASAYGRVVGWACRRMGVSAGERARIPDVGRGVSSRTAESRV
jgi:hypothetical protein